MSKPLIGIIMGSDSDLPIMSAAALMCEEFGVDFEVDIVSAHRTPEKLVEYASSAEARGLKVIIAGAGGAAHLPGMVASLTVLPVIGVPVRSASLDGMDSLLSIVQMPGGVPVATVAINGAKNAGILASQIVATSDANLSTRIAAYKKKIKKEVEVKSEKLSKIEYKEYLNEMGK